MKHEIAFNHLQCQAINFLSVESKTSHKLLLESLSDLMKWADSKLLLEDPLESFDKKEGRQHVEKLKDAAKVILCSLNFFCSVVFLMPAFHMLNPHHKIIL